MTGGLYGFSGAITNWLAIYMLFEKIPFLYGSGIITLRFESFKTHIRTMMMETFFREEDLQAHVGKLAGRLKQSFNPEQLAASVDMNILFDELISLAEESPLGGMLSVFGGRKLLESMRTPFCEKAGQKIPGIIRNAFNDAHIDPLKLVPVSEIRELIADAVERKLEELTPQHVKEIVENMIREHLGWLVFWGGVFELKSFENEYYDPTRIECILLHIAEKADRNAQLGLEEMKSLIDTLGFSLKAVHVQYRPFPDNKTYAGAGKLTEIKEHPDTMGVNLVITSGNMTPGQNNAVQDILDIETWDRTRTILEIFARNARTYESKLQVKLARHKYDLPRLKGLWSHLDRESGSGFNRGMGEKQLKVDRFLLKNNIARLEKSLKKIDNKRDIQKKMRRDFHKISLVGYTNAGKSSLFNLLTSGGVLSENRLFSTLDSKSGKSTDNIKPEIIFSDTVGFIRDLPLSLVASFRSTLSSLNDSDLLLHIIDSSSDDIDGHIETTSDILSEIGAGEIPAIRIFNKTDLADQLRITELSADYPHALKISCLQAEEAGEAVMNAIRKFFSDEVVTKDVLIPYSDSAMLGEYYKYTAVQDVEYLEEGIRIVAGVPVQKLRQLKLV
ncbi:hypothetical protein CHS0354_002034 [Potamilus streckersoni]|uniref:Hflx-type G domain-containing protein n=1 Tax=Potamilus streckersoni TaxID=2493646 RepID=A0AAE0T5Y9_9BIVA|nr:hypothetical protein CHS0354_002034 [Potamilus streckersoni]